MKQIKKYLLVGIMMLAMVLEFSVCTNAKLRADNQMDIVQTAQSNKDLTTLVKALDAAGLVDTLKGAGPFTVFAPTNEAFEKLPKGTLEELLKPENKDKLTNILTYHVKSGKVLAKDAVKLDGQSTLMLNGKPVKVEVKDGALYINNAKVVMADIQAKNGVIHIIDAVLIP